MDENGVPNQPSFKGFNKDRWSPRMTVESNKNKTLPFSKDMSGNPPIGGAQRGIDGQAWWTSNSNWIRNIILFVVWALLAYSVYAHLMWTYQTAINHAFVSDPTVTGLKLLFSSIIGIVLVIALLFTPGKSLKSPILHIAEWANKAYNSYKWAANTDPEKKQSYIIEFIVLLLIELGLVAAYYLLIKSVVRYDDSFMIDESIGMITVLSVGIVIAVFIAFTSYVVGKLEEIDSDNAADDGKRQAEKNKFTVVMVIWVILCISIGNAISGWAIEKAQANDGLVSNIIQLLWGERESVWGWEAELDIFH